MDRLYKGIQRFQETYYREKEEMFRELGKGQSPEVLFFCCSDSRVDPNVMTQSNPGDLFVVKNVGNIIPACNPHWKKSCTAAAIEFGVLVLNVTDIVVCAHSDCGAMKALYKGGKILSSAPNLKDWVETALPVKESVERLNTDPSFDACLEKTAKEHVIAQLENLKTYPLVAKALQEEKIRLHGWYYDIATGAVFSYNKKTNEFDKICFNEGRRDSAVDGEPCGSADEA